MRKTIQVLTIQVLLFALVIPFLTSNAAYAARNVDIVTFVPANDGGRFISQYQSQTLQQWRYNVGLYFDYAFEPFEVQDQTQARVAGIVDDLIMANLGAAVGLTDWWQVGFNFPLAVWEVFYDLNTTLTAGSAPKQNLYGKIADPRIDMKFRFLDIDRYRVGISVVPFIYLPFGKEEYFLGNGMYSGGGTLVLDFDIKNRIFFTLNGTYRHYRFVRYNANDPDAELDDTIGVGGGMSVRLNDEWGLLGEAWHEGVIKGYFQNQTQNPAEFLVGTRWTPQKKAKGLGVTLAAGRALSSGPGSPAFRVVFGVNYRKPAVVDLPAPVEVEAVVEEKIVITQKIHFEFDRAVVRDISRPILDDVASLLLVNSQILMVRIEGHTDWIGTEAYNQKLSEQRAIAVRDYLISKGVEAKRLKAVGYGETRPIADNNDVRGRARNRRTEFTVLEVAQE